MTQLLDRAVFSAAEVAAITGETRRTVQRKAHAGIYTAIKMPGRTGAFIFERTAVEAIIERSAAEDH